MMPEGRTEESINVNLDTFARGPMPCFVICLPEERCELWNDALVDATGGAVRLAQGAPLAWVPFANENDRERCLSAIGRLARTPTPHSAPPHALDPLVPHEETFDLVVSTAASGERAVRMTAWREREVRALLYSRLRLLARARRVDTISSPRVCACDKRIVAIGRELDSRLLSLRHEARHDTSSCTSLSMSEPDAAFKVAPEQSLNAPAQRWVSAWAARCELRRRWPVAAASLTKSELRRARARWDPGADARAARAGANARLPSPRLGDRRRGRGRRLRDSGLGVQASNSDETASTASSSLSFFSLMVRGLQDAHHDEAARRIQAGCRCLIRKLLFGKYYMAALAACDDSMPPDVIAVIVSYCVA